MGIKCYMIEPVFQGERVVGYRRPDTGEEHEFPHQFPAGAMWYAPWVEKRLQENPDWYNHYHLGPDGRVLMVRTPGGDWCIDSRSSNCTRPNEKHSCWCRHGEPPNVTVDKNGDTCSAGAGSIQAGKWHGFLKNGELIV